MRSRSSFLCVSDSKAMCMARSISPDLKPSHQPSGELSPLKPRSLAAAKLSGPCFGSTKKGSNSPRPFATSNCGFPSFANPFQLNMKWKVPTPPTSGASPPNVDAAHSRRNSRAFPAVPMRKSRTARNGLLELRATRACTLLRSAKIEATSNETEPTRCRAHQDYMCP